MSVPTEKKPFYELKPYNPAYRPPSEGPRPRGGSDFIPVGWSVRMVSVKSFAKELGISIFACRQTLKALEVPVWQPQDGPSAYFNLPTLEAALYALMRPSAHSWRSGEIGKSVLDALSPLDLVEEMQTVAAYYHHWTAMTMRRRMRRVARALHQVKKHPIADKGSRKAGRLPMPPLEPTPDLLASLTLNPLRDDQGNLIPYEETK